MTRKTFSSADGIEVLFVPDNRFKTTVVSFNFYLPLERETIAKNALLASILTTCSAEYPDYALLNARLSALYGTDLMSVITKVGDMLCVKFAVSVMNDAYALCDEKPVAEAINLLFGMLFYPKCENDAFLEEDIRREKRKLIEHIDGELNDKRTYARNRMIAEMFGDDPYGVYRYGTKEDVAAVTGTDLFSAWKTMLSAAFVRVHVVGAAMPENFVGDITARFHAFTRQCTVDVRAVKPLAKNSAPRTVTDRMEVAQGKLVMGFSTSVPKEDRLALKVMCDIFGGGPYSKLFNHVREEMSLCYYCSASAVASKGFMMVDCGVETDNAIKAQTEILRQLELMKTGEFTDFEFNSSIKSIRDSLQTSSDSPSAIDAWYTASVNDDQELSPDEKAKLLDRITREAVMRVAKQVTLHTVYRLLPKEDAQ